MRIKNDLPLENFNITNRNVMSNKNIFCIEYYLAFFEVNYLFKCERLFNAIKDNLQKNKFKMNRQRKIEIFGVVLGIDLRGSVKKIDPSESVSIFGS